MQRTTPSQDDMRCFGPVRQRGIAIYGRLRFDVDFDGGKEDAREADLHGVDMSGAYIPGVAQSLTESFSLLVRDEVISLEKLIQGAEKFEPEQQ